METIEVTTSIIINGYIIDPETGEVIGHVERKKEFHVTDMDSAEWVLDKLPGLASEVAGLAQAGDHRTVIRRSWHSETALSSKNPLLGANCSHL